MIAANAAEEDRERGNAAITPYWRTLKVGGFLNEKYPGGTGAQKDRLEGEGFTVSRKGRRYFVENFSEFLIPVE
jgi:hypothetical protein